ncbi:hypothetical protein A0J61_08192 [Choanephora cucurbitarum]|uniref:Uncharacterized protein n=1 Tax=Choanephora cucurbitarum TaxID=101091 RepID=A0A1C7N3Y9_9FUNG|nr:hypothetical protein A0J61_08192 [Choanephora cucurbitarum]
MPRSNSTFQNKVLRKLDDILNEMKSLRASIKNLEDRLNALKYHKNDEIQDMEENASIIPCPTKVSRVSGNLVRRKPIADDIKNALIELIPSVPVEEIYISVVKYCTTRSDEVVETFYNNKPPTWKHVPASTKAKMYIDAIKLIAKKHGVNMKRCENNWLVKSLVYTGYQNRFQALCRSTVKDRNINDDDKSKRKSDEEENEDEGEETDEETESDSEDDEVVVSQPQKRKSKQASGKVSRSHKKAKN